MQLINWRIDIDDVQEYWNVLENKIINVVDEISPLTNYSGNVIKENTPKIIRNKINRRNRLLKSFKRHPNVGLKKE